MLVRFSQKYQKFLASFSQQFYGTTNNNNKSKSKTSFGKHSNKTKPNHRNNKEHRFQANIADSPKSSRESKLEHKFERINDKRERSKLDTILSN